MRSGDPRESDIKVNATPAKVIKSSYVPMPYRPDVDGLRAVAIVPVVLFHAGLTFLPGGFVGVDVFFVISGYLIGAQIFGQSTAGNFRYVSFYARRLRRIIPALAVLIIVMFIVGWVLLTPSEMRELGKESVAAIFGASNILFFMGSDYFAPASDLKPLLHTWSLGVEEQFYLVLPMAAAILVRRLKAPKFLTLLVITACGMAASIVVTNTNAQAAFYLLPTRFWELSLGALLATSALDASPMVGRISRNLLGLCGLALVGIGVAAYRPEFPFPGWWALLPTLGTAMAIAGRGSWINGRLLANPAVTFVGKVSYSWYLWHWPLFYLARVIGIEGSISSWSIVLLSFLLAVFSWRVVEQPFRRRQWKSDGKVVLSFAAAIVGVAALGVFVYKQDGLPARLPAMAQASAEDARRTEDDPCLLRLGVVDVAPAGCRFASSSAGSRAVAVIGDSHAAAIAPGFARKAAGSGLGFRQLTKSQCTALWGFANIVENRPGFAAECLDYQMRAFDAIARDSKIGVVVLASRWSHEQELMTSSGSGHTSAGLEEGLESTLTRLEGLGRKIILVQDVPTFVDDPYAAVIGGSLPLRVSLRNIFGLPLVGSSSPLSQVESDSSRAILAKVASRHPNIELVDPWTYLCDMTDCTFRDGDDLYYFDNQHLTNVGADRAVGDRPLF